MKKIIILIPIYNDWTSLNKLMNEINDNINEFIDVNFECYVVNDASTIAMPRLQKPKNIKKIEILNMKINQGHARCNAFGIRYIFKNKKFDYLILMDGDGEDRPIEIKSLVNKVLSKPDYSVVAKRVKRSEGLFFQSLYQIHKMITYVFTGKNINFGNYSCLTKIDVELIHSKASLWSSYSGTVKKFLNNLNEINSTRGIRYFGPSQMSFLKLLIHSFSIIAVFKYQVFLRSFLLMIIFVFFNNFFGITSKLAYILIFLFNLIILAVSLREKRNSLLNSQNNLKNVLEITN